MLRVNRRELPVDVRLRGKGRLEQCKFPPLRLDFDPAETGESAFAGQDELKLVTHCINSTAGEKNLLEEYLAYRIFNLLSDYSYRVRLLHVSCVDTAGRPDRAAIRHVNLARDDIILLVGSTAGLTERDAKRTVDYLMDYFEKSEDEEKLLGKFEKQCLGR